MTNKQMLGPSTQKLTWGLSLLIAATLSLGLIASTGYVSFTLENARQQHIDIIGIRITHGLLFHTPKNMTKRETTSLWGFLANKSFSIEAVILTNGSQENFTCKANRHGSDYCSIEIHEHAIRCECFQ